MAILVNNYSEGGFKGVNGAKLTILGENDQVYHSLDITKLKDAGAEDNGILVGTIFRKGCKWYFLDQDELIPGNDKNWYGGCEDEIIKGLQKCSFNHDVLKNSLTWKSGNPSIQMKTDQVLNVPDSFKRKLRFDIRWNSSVTLDISAILCDAEGSRVDSVYYKNLQSLQGAVLLKSIQD